MSPAAPIGFRVPGPGSRINALTLVAALTLLLCALPAAADDFWKQMGESRDSLERWQLFEQAYAAAADEREKGRLVQTRAALMAELGRHDDAVATFPYPPAGPRDLAIPSPDEGWQAVDAVDYVLGEAPRRRFIVINEAHHVAQTRALTIELLPRLRALGYTHLAIEALDEQDTGLVARGQARNARGGYLREPVFAEMVRRALALGYVLVPYEFDGDTPEARENGQAEQLIARTLGTAPEARVLVHCGYAHAHEAKGFLFEAEPLAMQIRERTGHDPLTLDQTLFRADPKRREHPAYRALLEQAITGRPTILVRGDQAWSALPQHVDASVILPDAVADPSWQALGERVAFSPAKDPCRGQLPCLIEVAVAGAPPEAVPAQRCLRLAARDCDRLWLPPGRLRLIARDGEGRTLARRSIEVRPGGQP